ncbi:MAG: AAA family ATPase [Nonomuraea sp.]|nr:AAA family ATPase [Nonomuraea sp.]
MQGATLRYPPGSLVVLTGLPGAGKTTLLRRLYGLDGAENVPVMAGATVVIDSGQSRLRWDGRITWAPRAVRRAVVFATHVRRISRALALGRSVVAHNRGCGPYVLAGFAWLARRRRASFHLLLLDAPPQDAIAGQHARGRVVAPRTFDRHRRRCERLLAQVRNGDPAPASTARVITRAEAGLLEHIVFGAPEHAPAD